MVQAFSNFFSSILNNFKFIDIEICKNFVDKYFIKNISLNKLIPVDLQQFEFGNVSEVVVMDKLKKNKY